MIRCDLGVYFDEALRDMIRCDLRSECVLCIFEIIGGEWKKVDPKKIKVTF
jgi:hypothetical protein